MKREVILLVFGMFLMVFMIGSLIAEESVPSTPSSGGGGGGGGGSAEQNRIETLQMGFNNTWIVNKGTPDEGIVFSVSLANFSYSSSFEINESGFFLNDIWDPKIDEIKTGKLYINLRHHDFFNDSNSFKVGEYMAYLILGDEKYYGVLMIPNSRVLNKIDFDGSIITSSKGASILFSNSKGDKLFFNDVWLYITHNETSIIADRSGIALLDGFYIYRQSDYEIRISTLESWQKTINNTLTSIQNSITTILNTLTGHNTRITNLENQTPGNNSQETFPSYLMKLSSSDRKDVVCAYGEENHLYGVQGLGWTCGLTYKTSSSGRVTAKCNCKKG